MAEAGFFPGIILYLTYWYPAVRRSQMTAWFMSAAPLSGLIGGPVSGWILHHFHGHHGWAGWQWLFVLEGLPAVVLGIALINALGNLAGFFGPSIIGWVKQTSQSASGGILVLAGFMVLCAVLVLLTPKPQK